MVMMSVVELYVGAAGVALVSVVVIIVMTSSGSGRVASVLTVPYSSASRAASLTGSVVVLSIVMIAVGLYSVPPIVPMLTGVVLTSHENVIASGESLIVA